MKKPPPPSHSREGGNPGPARIVNPRSKASEGGVALICALMLMLATMLVGVSVSRAVFASIASARGERERGVAREAAEAALRDAEHDIAASTEPARAAWFAAPGAPGFPGGCGRGDSDRGLCADTSPPAWQLINLAESGGQALTPYGHYSGAQLAVGQGLLPARLPAYLIERFAPPGASEQLGTFYRITAIGFGTLASTQVVLQSVYRKPKPDPPGGPAAGGEAPPGPGSGKGQTAGEGVPGWPGGAGTGPGQADPSPAGQGPAEGADGKGNGSGNGAAGAGPPPVALPAGRISWREIANWPHLHAQALE